MSDPRHVVWTPDRFYWGVLDATLLPPRLRRRPEQLGFLLEPLVPQPLDELHAVYQPLDGGRVLACAADRAALAEAAGPAVETLCPSALPEFLAGRLHPDRLNLLTGPFTPAVVRDLERRHVGAIAALVAVVAALLAVGMERRARAADRVASGLAAQESAVVRDVLGESSARAALPLPLQLEAELRSLRRTRAADSRLDAPADAAVALTRTLSAWPAGVPVRTDAIHVTPEAIHVQGSLPTSDDAQALARSLSNVEGWRLRQPTVRAVGDGFRATLRLERAEGSR